MDLAASVQHGADQMIERRNITLHRGLESKFSACIEYRDPVVTDRAREDDHISDPCVRAANRHPRSDDTDAGCCDVETIGLRSEERRVGKEGSSRGQLGRWTG